MCNICERHCIIDENSFGFCKTRKNIDGKIYTLKYGEISSISVNPIEKKPLFHFWPGSFALTAGSFGCNFTCDWCQNYEISKNPTAKGEYISPEDFVKIVKEKNCQGTSISFNEPTLMLEYAIDVFSLASKEGYYNTFVTNGYMGKEALKALAENGLDAMNIDIKGDEKVVKEYCNANVEIVWRNAEIAIEQGIWIELTTLVITGLNDREEILRGIAKRIYNLGENIPWHITRYFPSYKFSAPPTDLATLEKAYKIGKEEGLNYVYIGNVPFHPYENTYCPSCNELLIKRSLYDIKCKIENNRCPKCGEKIPIIGKKL
ncbi:MAG: AmmeMemoRadiSam system radical SAM enzyme [Candidatus Thermoplasmatota archaeon]